MFLGMLFHFLVTNEPEFENANSATKATTLGGIWGGVLGGTAPWFLIYNLCLDRKKSGRFRETPDPMT
jgi:hypothetical protein